MCTAFAGVARAQQQVASGEHPPEWTTEYGDERSVEVGEDLEFQISATDKDQQPISFQGSDLPQHMRLTVTRQDDSTSLAVLHWKPGRDDIGPHELTLTATDGRSSISKTLKVTVEENWESYLMPGLQYSLYVPAGRADHGIYQGGSGEILFGSWIRRNENRGPSHGRVYLDMDVLKSSHSDQGAAFDLTFGFDLSIERNPLRRFLLPYFGLKFGGFVQKQSEVSSGGFWEVTPQLGLYLYADRNLFVNASVGYLLPISGDSFDSMRGLRSTLGIDFSLW